MESPITTKSIPRRLLSAANSCIARVGAEIVVMTRLVFTESSQLGGESQGKQTPELPESVCDGARFHPRARRFIMDRDLNNLEISAIDFYFRLEEVSSRSYSLFENMR